MDRRAVLGLAAGALAGAAGCLGGRGAAEGEWDVGMTDSDFTPPELSVAAGTTVVWENTSQRSHTVTAYDDGLPDGADYFASGGYGSEAAARTGWQDGLGGAISPGDAYEHTFEVPGEYPYFCVPHEPMGMTGTVVVTE